MKLGDKAKDKITGFTGILTGKAEYLTGCSQYCIQPECSEKTDAYPSATWFDEGRIVVIEQSLTKEDVASDENGCDYCAPIK